MMIKKIKLLAEGNGPRFLLIFFLLLEGLPEKFSPASFDFEKRELKISGEIIYFSPYIKACFAHANLKDLIFSASWYHDQIAPSLPPYLALHITMPEKDYHYRLLIDMEKKEIYRFYVVVKEAEGATRDIEVSEKLYLKILINIYDSTLVF